MWVGWSESGYSERARWFYLSHSRFLCLFRKKPSSFGNISNLIDQAFSVTWRCRILSPFLFFSKVNCFIHYWSMWSQFFLLVKVSLFYFNLLMFSFISFISLFFFFFFRCLWSEFWYPCCRTGALSNTCHWRKCDFYCCVRGFAEWMHLT